MLVFGHWNGKEMVSGLWLQRLPRGELPVKKGLAGWTGLPGGAAAAPGKLGLLIIDP